MRKTDTVKLLTYISILDKRTIAEPDIEVWSELIPDEITLEEAKASAMEHFRTSTEYLKPAHIIGMAAAVRRVRRERIQAAGPPDYPTGLTWAQEQRYRVDFQAAIGSGMSRAEAQAATDARFQVKRPELVTKPIGSLIRGAGA